MIYKISTDDFAKQTGEFDLIKVLDGVVYINATDKLKKPFVSVADSQLPLEVVEAQNERENQLTAVRNAKLAELNKCRDEFIASGVEYNGVVYDSDTASQALLSQAISRYSRVGSVPEGFMWIAKDNSLNALSLDDLIALEGEMAKQLYTGYIKANALKTSVRNAMSLEAINGVVWA